MIGYYSSRPGSLGAVLEAIKSKASPEQCAAIDVVQAMLIQATANMLPDSQLPMAAPALKAWEQIIAAGGNLLQNEPFVYSSQLYRATQAHTPQAHYPPSIHTLALYRPIAPPEPDAGTEDNPIEYITGLACEAGKYYLYAGILYRCTRDYPGNTGHNPAQLVGHYFEIVA